MSLEESVEALRYLGLFSNLDASSIMSTRLHALHPQDRVAQARAVMRENSISGVPIVDEQFHLVGLISVSKIIEALADGRLADSVDSVMTRDVVSLKVLLQSRPMFFIVKDFLSKLWIYTTHLIHTN